LVTVSHVVRPVLVHDVDHDIAFDLIPKWNNQCGAAELPRFAPFISTSDGVLREFRGNLIQRDFGAEE
jgi:hypothetical protein